MLETPAQRPESGTSAPRAGPGSFSFVACQAGSTHALAAPLRQRPYDQALQLGFDVLSARPPSREKLGLLGVAATAGVIRLPVLNRCLFIDLEQRRVLVDKDGPARSAWAVLAVHYLCAENLAPDSHAVSFSYFQDCRSYLSVFGKRITARFLATSGRTSALFTQIAEQCAGAKVPGSGTGYSFEIFPRLPITIVRHEGDDEICPGASVIYRADAEHLLPAEDRVVAAELLLDYLSGKSMYESGGLNV
ncbi:MAG: DUF3786 domain-containing protein [bacterium]